MARDEDSEESNNRNQIANSGNKSTINQAGRNITILTISASTIVIFISFFPIFYEKFGIENFIGNKIAEGEVNSFLDKKI